MTLSGHVVNIVLAKRLREETFIQTVNSNSCTCVRTCTAPYVHGITLMYGALIYMIPGAQYQIIVATCLSSLVDLIGITPPKGLQFVNSLSDLQRDKFPFMLRIISFPYVNIVSAKNM